MITRSHSRVKFFLFIGCLLVMAGSPFSFHTSALTYQEIADSQTKGQVLGASTNGLVGYWNFDEGSGSAINDTSGNNNNGIISGAAWTTGVLHQGLDFGTLPASASVPNSASLKNDYVTLSFWVKLKSNGPNWGNMVTFGSGPSNRAYGVELGGTGNSFYGWANNTSGVAVSAGSTQGIVLGVWHHVALTFDGSKLSFYEDGALNQQVNLTGTLYKPSASLAIGGGANSPNMILDEVRLYNRALSQSEIGSLYLEGGVDLIPPSVAVTNPSSGATVSGAVNLAAVATDNIGVASVQFSVDGANVGPAITIPPYAYQWDSTTLPGGSHAIRATAVDPAGNRTVSTALTVMVNNSGLTSYQIDPNLDSFGGSTQLKCSSATGHFFVEKISNRWWLCTPLGNALFSNSLGGINSPGSGTDPSTGQSFNYDAKITAKYGNPAAIYWGPQQNRRLLNWGFNTVGQISSGYVSPFATDGRWPGDSSQPVKLPAITYVWTLHANTNQNNYASQPTKDVMYGLNPNYKGWRSTPGQMDFFDGNIWQWMDANVSHQQANLNSPYLQFVIGDDTDWIRSFGAGPDLPTSPVGNMAADAGWLTLIASPVQTYNDSVGIRQLYSDTKVYSKTAALNLPASCDISSPCSLRDFLYKKYNGAVAALNTAWGSNYTSFDSTGVLADETIGVGDGTTKVFTYTLAHATASPLSIQIFKGPKLEAGDCPWWYDCKATAAYTGALAGGASTDLLAGVTPWLSDVYGKPVANYPRAAYWTVITYHFPPASGAVSALSRQVGSAFYTGSQQPFVIAPGQDTGGLATGYDVYMACRYTSSYSGPKTFGCANATDPQPPLTLQAQNVPIGTDWGMPGTGLAAGAALPSPSSFINYASGAMQVSFASPPAPGETVKIKYVYNGWMSGGRGLMDEDGSNKAWVGTNPNCLKSTDPIANCSGAINANQALAADLYSWDAQFSAEYNKNMRSVIKKYAPNTMYFGPDVLGTWGAPARKDMLQGAAPYLDGFWSTFTPTQQNVDYIEQYLGDKPIIGSDYYEATPDSALWRFAKSSNEFQTQAARGQATVDAMTALINLKAASTNSYPLIGNNWWGFTDFWNEKLNWGLVSLSDNAYDGKEAVIAPGTDPWGYATGGEERNYGDVISYIKRANSLWYNNAGLNAASVILPFVPAGAQWPVSGGAGASLDSSPPTVPANLTATTDSSGITLSWTASTDNVGVAGYAVYRDGSPLAGASATNYQDASVLPSVSYVYKVLAFDAVGNKSSLSAPVTIQSAGGGGGSSGPVLPRISDLVGSNTTASTTTISWQTNVPTNGQVFYGTTTAYGLSSALVNVSPMTASHSVILNNLLAATLYHFKATSIDSLSNSTTTADFIFTTLSSTSTPPVNPPSGGGGGGGSGGGGSSGGGSGPSGGGSGPVPIVYIPPASPLPNHPQGEGNGSLRLVNQNGTFYLLKNSQRYGITSPGILYSYGFEFKDAQTPTAADLALPVGTLLLPGNGYLVKSPIDKTVYLISQNQRYAFTSETVFKLLGFSFNHVFVVTDPELQSLPKGSDIGNSQSAHLPGLDINRNGTIYWVSDDNQLHGYPSLSVYNSWHKDNDFTQVVPANQADAQLPVGDLVGERILN